MLGHTSNLLAELLAEHEVFTALAGKNVDDDLLDRAVGIRDRSFVWLGRDLEINRQKALARDGICGVSQLQG
jgi:hypothetical protein